MQKRKLYYLKAFGYSFLEEKNNKQFIQNFNLLKQKITNCHLCNLSKNRTCSQIDDYEKNKNLMIVLNNIIKEEDKNDIILNSKNGQKLKQYIKNILNLENKDYYVSYIYKCLNLKNDAFALNYCLPYLFDEIKIIKPKIILCIGKDAFENLGFDNFDGLIGEYLNFQNTNFIATYDLYHIEKNPSCERKFIDILYKIKGKI